MPRRKKAKRARNRFGRFMDRTASANPRRKKRRTGPKHAVKRHLRKVPGKKRRVSVKRHMSHELLANPRKRAKRRSLKRKRPGHHKHTVRRHLRKVAGRKRRVAVKRHRSHEVAAASNPRKKKRRKARASEAIVKANPRRRRKRRAAAREVLVMAKANPRKRRRRARKSAREEVLYEAMSNPRRRKKKRSRASYKRKRPGHKKHNVRRHLRKVRGKKRRVAVKRHRSHEGTVRANPRRRKKKRVTRRSRALRATVRGRARRSGGRTSAAKVIVVLGKPTHKRRKAKGKRRSSARKRKGSKRKSSRRTPKSHRLGMEGMYANPVYGGLAGPYSYEAWDDEEGYLYENPLSGGELGLAFVTGGLGIAVANVLSRYVSDKTKAAGVSTVDAINGPVGIWAALSQVGLTAAGLGGAYFVKQPMARAALQGFSLGVGLHLVGQVIKGYVFAKALKGNSFIQGLFGSEIASANALAAPAAAPKSGAQAGYPGLAGAPFGYLGDPGPYAVGVGQGFAAFNAGSSPGATSTIPGVTAPAGGCGPCGQSPDMTTSQMLTNTLSPVANAQTSMAAVQSAYKAATQATRAENCGGAVSGLPEEANGMIGERPRIKPYNIFPE